MVTCNPCTPTMRLEAETGEPKKLMGQTALTYTAVNHRDSVLLKLEGKDQHQKLPRGLHRRLQHAHTCTGTHECVYTHIQINTSHTSSIDARIWGLHLC